MTGLEKMKSQILDEAKAAAESKVSEAQCAGGRRSSVRRRTRRQKSGKNILQKSAAEVKGVKNGRFFH